MAKGHRVQHKPQRESAVQSKETRELKQENRTLKKQLAKARKDLAKLIDASVESQNLLREEGAAAPEDLATKDGGIAKGCPSCQSVNITAMKVPSGTLEVCKDCHYRKLLKRD